eukprot:TRINITY_DN1524_c0_g1_i1.p1 TRINITY_DN1524_c0_g1~~TRINITY_DN1524_c0_g1_i1.p1  ORF type:complete len:290 (+),score=54.57 TRINITY_DN1524_c0_g1_i1:141-1010(+)
MDKQNVAKDVTSAVCFEEELQICWKEGGICVVDLYSTTWGYCRAIAPTFWRLFYEADEALKLKFLTVDATACLHELDNPPAEPPRREFHRPKNTEQIKETLPDFWRPLLQKQAGHSKPLFLFYKEGRFIKSIHGVQTPEICNTIADLTTVKTPASEYITNPLLLDVWTETFNPNESEVGFDKFLLAVNVLCKCTVPLNEDELSQLRGVLDVNPKDNIVTAEALQNWVGSGTIMQAFSALLPNYEERAIQVRLEAEAAKRAEQNKQQQAPAAEQAQEGDESFPEEPVSTE